MIVHYSNLLKGPEASIAGFSLRQLAGILRQRPCASSVVLLMHIERNAAFVVGHCTSWLGDVLRLSCAKIALLVNYRVELSVAHSTLSDISTFIYTAFDIQ